MGCNVDEVAYMSGSSSGKVHVSMCKELAKIIKRTLDLVPAIEKARPGFRLGITELVSLNCSVEKAKLLLERCAESSKLYLAITGETFQTRCNHIKGSIIKSLSHIHNMVPEPIASQISDAINSFGDLKFAIDSSDIEARKALVSLLIQNDTTEDSELKGFQVAAFKLHLTSSRSLLAEKRCVQKLLEKCTLADLEKQRILKYLLHLIIVYGKKIQATTTDDYKENVIVARNESSLESDSSCGTNLSEKTCMFTEKIPEKVSGEIKAQSNISGAVPIPEKFKCPISSRIMYDPVIIGSGQTYERKFIEKWFSEGHNTCPVTNMKLSDLFVISNASLKDIISEWCREHGIVLQDSCSTPMPVNFRSWNSSSSSLNSVYAFVVNNKNADYSFTNNYSSMSLTTNSITQESSETKVLSQMFVWSDDYQNTQSFSEFNHDSYMRFLSKLSELPSESRREAMEDFETTFGKDDGTCSLMLSNGFLTSLISFLKDAYDSSNLVGQKSVLEVLLVFLSYMREEVPSLIDDVSCLLTCFLYLENLSLEELKVIRALCFHYNCRPVIVASAISKLVIKTICSEDPNLLEVVMDILFQLSSLGEMSSLFLSSGYLPNMVLLLLENQFAGRCARILQNICNTEEGKRTIAAVDGLVVSLVELLENGRKEDQAVAVALLLSLCSCSSENCDLVMKEGIIPPLVDISINGIPQSVKDSKLLLQLLRDYNRSKDSLENSADTSDEYPSGSQQPYPTINVSATENPRPKDEIHSNSTTSGRTGTTSSRTKKQSMKSSTSSGVSGIFKRTFFIFSKPKHSTPC